MRPQQFSNEELLHCARRLFIEQGSQISMNSIADVMGVSQAALFKRYKTKRELIIASLCVREIPQWIQDLKILPDGRSFEGQLKDIVESVIAFFNELSPALNIMRIENINPSELMEEGMVPPPILALQELTQWLMRCNQKGLIGNFNFETLAKMILGGVHFNSMMYLIIGNKKIADMMPNSENFACDVATLVRELTKEKDL